VILLKDAERRTTSVQWPVEVDDRLDLLVRVAADEGIPVSRAQMLSALVADASLDQAWLADVARRYLQAREGALADSAPAQDRLPAVKYRGRQRGQPVQPDPA
jgi:hypothetical protein